MKVRKLVVFLMVTKSIKFFKYYIESVLACHYYFMFSGEHQPWQATGWGGERCWEMMAEVQSISFT